MHVFVFSCFNIIQLESSTNANGYSLEKKKKNLVSSKDRILNLFLNTPLNVLIHTKPYWRIFCNCYV